MSKRREDPEGATITNSCCDDDDSSSESGDENVPFVRNDDRAARRRGAAAARPTARDGDLTSPTGIVVRRRSPGSGTVSQMSSPTPTNSQKNASKKPKGKSKKRSNAPEQPSLLKTTNHGPASKYDEAKADRACRASHGIIDAEDSDEESFWDDPQWEEELLNAEELEGLKVESLAVEPNCVESDTTCAGNEVVEAVGGPEGWKPHGPPPGWKPRERKNDQPEFDMIDNPGNWPEFIYRPAWKNARSGKGCVDNQLPTGCTPAPQVYDGPNEGKRIEGGWEFNYTGTWTSPEGCNFRHGATRDNMFPKERRGRLCAATLKKLGMSKLRLSNPALGGKADALFFEQLALPMCDTLKSGIVGDPRIPFYEPCAVWTNKCATYDCRLGATYGHKHQNASAKDLVVWDGVVQMDAALGNSNGALHRRWDPDCKQCDEDIANAMGTSRFQQIKQVYKMCDNSLHPKKGEPGYDPAYKFEFIWRVMCHNINAITEVAELDGCGDETTFSFGAFGEAGTGLISKADKPHTSRGGQVVIVSDVHRVRPRAFVVRHKCHKKTMPGQTMGPTEVHMILKQFDKMLVTPAQPADHPARKLLPHDKLTCKPNPDFLLEHKDTLLQ